MDRGPSRRQDYPLMDTRRPRSIATIKLEKNIKVLILIASMFRLNYVHGLILRGTPAIYASHHLPRALSIVTSSATMTAITPGSRIRSTIPSIYQSSSSLTMSKSTPSSSVEKSIGNFHSVSLSISTMEMMEEVGALIAILSKQTDVLFLDGDLGAGKTTFSRGFIKCKLGIEGDDYGYDENDDCEDTAATRVGRGSLRITSPTYLLSNTYEYREDVDLSEEDIADGEPTREIHHMDLYRLSGKSAKDFDPLDLRRVFSNCISLIEWPSRLQAFPELLPQEDTLLKIDIRIPDPTSDERVMSLVSTNESSWTFRIKNLIEEGMIDDLLLHNDDHEDNNTGDETSDSEPN